MKFASDLNFCLIPRSLIRVTGKDRLRVINNFFTNQIDGLSDVSVESAPGVEGLFTNAKGRIHTHAFVYVFEDHILVETGGGADYLVSHLDQYVISEDVEFETLDALAECIVVYGLHDSVQKIVNFEARKNIFAKHMPAQNQYELLNSLLGYPTFVVAANNDAIRDRVQLLRDLGAIERSSQEMERDRIAAGIPRFPNDFSDANFPPGTWPGRRFDFLHQRLLSGAGDDR